MQLYVVTTQSKEETRDGVTLSVRVNTHGVFCTSDVADAIALKYGGEVVPLVMDKEYDFRVLQKWLNPGYKK